MVVKCILYTINKYEVRVVRIMITGYSQKLSENNIQNGRIKQKPKLGLPKLGRTTPAPPRNIRGMAVNPDEFSILRFIIGRVQTLHRY